MALPRFSFPAPGGRRSATPPAAGVLMPGDERFLHGSRQAELVEPMPRALWALYLLCVIVVVTGVWAAQARVDIVAKAPGKVAPGGHEQVIASLEGGLLAELLVREGDLVEAGAELVRLDPTRFAAIIDTGGPITVVAPEVLHTADGAIARNEKMLLRLGGSTNEVPLYDLTLEVRPPAHAVDATAIS